MEVSETKDMHRFEKIIAVKNMDFVEKNNLSEKNFGLSEKQFEVMISDLNNSNDKLFEQAFLNHFERSMKYLINKHNAENNVAYDVTMNTLLELRKRIIQGKVSYGNLNFLFTQMCVQRYKRLMGKKVDFDRYQKVNTNDEEFDDEMFDLLDEALGKMGEECRAIIKDVYYNKIAYKTLESKYSKTAAALRKQKERCIIKLKMLIRQNLNSL